VQLHDTAHEKLTQIYRASQEYRDACVGTSDKNIKQGEDAHIWKLEATFWLFEDCEKAKTDAETDALLGRMTKLDMDGVGGIGCLFARSAL
jgi:hypothetical protein